MYAASLYTNNRYGNEWFVYIGATACGLTAGIFWAAEGAIMIGCKSRLSQNQLLLTAQILKNHSVAATWPIG